MQARQYSDAIDLSVKMAEIGITLATTTIGLCSKLYDPNCPITELLSTVEVMESLVNEGRTDAWKAEKGLKDVVDKVCTLPVIHCRITNRRIVVITKTKHRYGNISKA